MTEAYTSAGAWPGSLLDAQIQQVALTDRADDLAVVDRDGRWSYRQLDQWIDRCANALLSLGVHAGDVVSWQLPNWVESIVVHHASLRIGAVSNPVVPIYRQAELDFILRQAQSRVLVIPQSYRSFAYVDMARALQVAIPTLEHLIVVGGEVDVPGEVSFEIFTGSASATKPAVCRDADDVCLLLYTSGTTSSPKGVLHSHNTLGYENKSLEQFYGLGSDVVFMPSPLTHITGVLYGMHLPFMLRSSVVLQDTWDPELAINLIETHKATFMLAATPFLHGILTHPARDTHDLSSLRVFACGGADVPPELVRRARALLDCHVARVYGSTEFPTATSSAPRDSEHKCAETDGRAIGLAEIRVVDTDGGEGPGVTGEVRVRGPEMFLGYADTDLDDDSFDPDGWFLTGDLGIIDRDGYLTVVGRKKDIIIRGGENISAKEVEDYLFLHPAIADVAVVGYPDVVLTERVSVVVVVEHGFTVRLEDIAAWLEARKIARQKIPDRVFFTDSLPRTASGKVQKFKLRAYVRDQLSAGRDERGVGAG